MERTYVHFRYLVSEKRKAKNTCIAARLIWQLVIRSCVIFAYIISRKDGENNGLLNSLSLPFQIPATQASLHGLRTADVFPVFASLPSLLRERSDDRKCREKWKRVLDVLAQLALLAQIGELAIARMPRFCRCLQTGKVAEICDLWFALGAKASWSKITNGKENYRVLPRRNLEAIGVVGASEFTAVFLRWISQAASLESPTLVNLYIPLCGELTVDIKIHI